MDGESCGRNQFVIGHGSESKGLLGQKRGILDVEETSDGSQIRVKIRDLESVFHSEAQGEIGDSSAAHPDVNSGSRALDLNVEVSSVNNTVVGDDAPSFVGESNNLPNKQAKVEHNNGVKKARGLDVDLNVEDISSSINDPFYAHKNYENLKSMDELECGSSVGQKDLMRVWKGLKQNNYMSSTYGAVPVPFPVPKPRGRKKTNNDVTKRKIELAKKEQVDRFAQVAAPSGLLNGLNPGIINHVRNSKQVHSIIEALVRSERTENQRSGSKKGNQIKNGVQEPTERKEQGNVHGLGRQQMSDDSFISKSVYTNKVVRGDGDLHKGQTRTFSRMPSQCNVEHGDDKLALKLSSVVTAASDNTGCLINDESDDLGAVTSLSIKAARIASQWLELLNQDIRGRLAALRRSKRRVRAVITSELPLLISREFSSYSDQDSGITKTSEVCHRDQTSADTHTVRWSTLFEKMDKALSEEEYHLESWLNQVKEMQLQCEKGLYMNNLYQSSQQAGPNRSDSRFRTATDDSAKDLALRAAAASIYSTCNFLLSTENLPCC